MVVVARLVAGVSVQPGLVADFDLPADRRLV